MGSNSRIRALQRFLKRESIDAILVEDVLNIFYLTGMELSVGTLIVTKSTSRLVVDNRYYESCRQHSPIPVVLLQTGWFETLFTKRGFQKIQSLGFDSENTTYDRFLDHKKNVRILDKNIRLKPLSNPVRHLRMIKSPDEIKALKKAAELGSQGFDYVCTLLKSGISEIEVAQELEIFWKRKGSKGVAFESIIAFGENSSKPHYKPSKTKLKKGQPILIDIGVNLGHYHSDMTRVPFLGKPKRKMEEIYSVVLEAQEEALKYCSPGTNLIDVDAAAREVIAEYGYGECFIHSLGHGIGLEVHELPFFKKGASTILEEGMVITIEPGVYLPGVGGVRIEDTVVITKNGHENLTKRPKELLIL